MHEAIQLLNVNSCMHDTRPSDATSRQVHAGAMVATSRMLPQLLPVAVGKLPRVQSHFMPARLELPMREELGAISHNADPIRRNT